VVDSSKDLNHVIDGRVVAIPACMSNTIKITATQKATLAEIELRSCKGKSTQVHYTVYFALIESGMARSDVDYSGDNVEMDTDSLTAEGKAFAVEVAKIAESKRMGRNAAARVRSGALRSVGLKRTRSGSWE
jgi:hypothetical protein